MYSPLIKPYQSYELTDLASGCAQVRHFITEQQNNHQGNT